uniref:AlNc14C1340G12899 protein n=1 Tax=Albugo laibachii Nc14 TaxID=890382 RepID=F0X2N5_9STRA|nr:AlNc14C1340G12899 [Albugo laibachii Nc14]|eukprot:CCA28155.1 AlNc14C1340G12899 [Albugo laibachii Nc14]
MLSHYTNDHWIHFLTDESVIWIPGHHCRLLPTNVMLSLLRSEVGVKCRSQWFGGKWRGALCDDIDELSVNLGYFPEDDSTLHLTNQDGETKWISGPLQREC